jgi:prolyl-tRNA editing enzyme YbaK/EbsC (Cys-tRNA(Pro) deacylase)
VEVLIADSVVEGAGGPALEQRGDQVTTGHHGVRVGDGDGDGDGASVLILPSGAHRVDTAKVAAELGHRKLRRGRSSSKEHTGQSIAGAAPVGHPHQVATSVDTALEQYDVVWAAAGIPHSVFPTTYAELLALTIGNPITVN